MSDCYESREEELTPATYEAVMTLLRSVNPVFSRDGDMYCFLLGENLQEGVSGFGKTAWIAAQNFSKDFFGKNSHADKGGFAC